jgi:hypothetical protein
MKAMNQVMPGKDLPVSFLTNSQGFDVEGAFYYPPIPMYKKLSGDCVIRFHFEWRERLQLLKHRKGAESKLRQDPALNTAAGFPIDNTMELSQLAKSEWPRFFLHGNIWQTLNYQQGRFVPFSLTAKCPLPEKEKAPEFSKLQAYMSANGMIGETGEAEAVIIERDGEQYKIHGYPGAFRSLYSALSSLGDALRKKNKGKWSNGKDGMTRGPEEPMATGMFTPLLCPACEVPLVRGVAGGKPFDISWSAPGTWYCRKCQSRYTYAGPGKVEPFDGMVAGKMWVSQALAAGFSEDQAELIRRLFEALK